MMAAMCLTDLKRNSCLRDKVIKKRDEPNSYSSGRVAVQQISSHQDNDANFKSDPRGNRGASFDLYNHSRTSDTMQSGATPPYPAVVVTNSAVQCSHAESTSSQFPQSMKKEAVLQVELMLQSYEREMSSVEGALREMEDNLDTTRFREELGIIIE
jgi:hypothetical protein